MFLVLQVQSIVNLRGTPLFFVQFIFEFEILAREVAPELILVALLDSETVRLVPKQFSVVSLR